MQFADINGVTLHYQTIGADEDKPLLVFVNSLGTDFRIWRDVIVRMVGSYGILTYDKRGHGLSSLGETPYSMDDHVDDLAGLLDYLKVGPVIICGLSVGGMIAQGLFGKRPELVRALILCDTGHKIGNQSMWNDRISQVEQGGIEAISDGVLERWFTEQFRGDDNAAFTGYRTMLERTPVAGYCGTAAAIRDCDFTGLAQTINVPTMCVVGQQDGATPPSLVSELARLIPGALYQEIHDSGHLPPIEQPLVLYEVIKAFLDQMSKH